MKNALCSNLLAPSTALVIAGAPGVGKTTLAKTLAGAVAPVEKQYLCAEQVVFKRGGIAMPPRRDVVIIEEFIDLRNLAALQILAETSSVRIIITTALPVTYFTAPCFNTVWIERGRRP